MQTLITYGDSHLSIGTMIGLPLMVLIALAITVACGIFAWVVSDESPVLGAAGGLVAMLLCAGLILLGMWPLSGEYHHWQKISGTVTSTNSRFISKDKGTDQKFVVTFDGSDQQFGCSDTRCAGIRKGDYLTITCKRSFQWFGTPGYDCNYVSYKPAGGAA